jgi:phage-related protein
MTQPGRAGRASIEIVGDVSRLGRQLERDAQRAVSDIDLDTSAISDQLGDAFADGVDEAITHLSDLDPAVVLSSKNYVNRFKEAADEVVEVFDDAGDRIRDTFARNERDSDRLFDNIGENARDAGDDVRTNLLRPLTAGFSRLSETITSAGSALVGFAVTGTNPAGLLSLALTAAAVAAAIPVIIGLAAALADLAGVVTLLPGAVGALSASLIVGIVAFQGFGDAISAVIDGDPEKIAEAMERLAPAARTVVREFERVLPLFRQLGDEIQQGFFGQLTGIVERFGQDALPQLRDELLALSTSMGRAFGDLGNLVTTTENVSILERLLLSTSRIAGTLGEAFTNLGQSFFNAIDAGLPSLETLSTRLGEAITNFANFINASIADGSFQEFLDDAVATLDELLSLGGAVGELLGVLFSGTDDAGRGFIGTLTDITKRLTEFFKSAEGQDALEDMAETIETIGTVLGISANLLRTVIDIFTELDDIVNDTIETTQALALGMVDAWNIITGAVSTAVSAVGRFFSDLGSGIANTWNGAVEVVSSAIETVIAFVSALPGRIGTFIESIPTRVATALDSMFDLIIDILGTAIATVIVFFTGIPGQIVGALGAFMTAVRDTFTGARDDAVGALTGIGAFIQSIPSLFAAAWEAVVLQVVTTFNAIRESITTAWESIISFISTIPGRVGAFFQQMNDAVVARVTSLVEFVKGIPGQVLAAIGNLGRLLYSAGANVIQGLIDGIGSRIGQLRDKISSAVQTIRDHLPFSPAKVGPLSGSGSPDRAGAAIGSMLVSGLDSQLASITEAAGRVAGAAGIPLSPLGEAGVTPLASPLPGQRGTVLSPVSERTDEQLVVLVTIGGEEVYAIIDKRVEAAVSTEVRRLVAGTREI